MDTDLEQVDPAAYDALVLPGGQINPDKLRLEPKALAVIKSFVTSGKVVAAICHAPWLLIEIGAAKGRDLTSFSSIRTDVINAGGRWHDQAVVTDQGIVTSRNPGDLDAFWRRSSRRSTRAGTGRARSPPESRTPDAASWSSSSYAASEGTTGRPPPGRGGKVQALSRGLR